MSGEFIGIEYAPSNQYRLILSPLIDLDIQHHIEIGDSFTDFLARLESGQTWFDDINYVACYTAATGCSSWAIFSVSGINTQKNTKPTTAIAAKV
jgi:hypothetical protein